MTNISIHKVGRVSLTDPVHLAWANPPQWYARLIVWEDGEESAQVVELYADCREALVPTDKKATT